MGITCPSVRTRRRQQRADRSQRWVRVSWSVELVEVRELHDGLPVLAWGRAPRDVLATRRQLRVMGLRPGGQAPAAYVTFRHRRHGQVVRRVYAGLYLVETAKPVRPMTMAKWLAVDAAIAARCTCQRCGTQQPRCLSTRSRMCTTCETATSFWDTVADHEATARGWAA